MTRSRNVYFNVVSNLSKKKTISLSTFVLFLSLIHSPNRNLWFFFIELVWNRRMSFVCHSDAINSMLHTTNNTQLSRCSSTRSSFQVHHSEFAMIILVPNLATFRLLNYASHRTIFVDLCTHFGSISIVLLHLPNNSLQRYDEDLW